MSQRYYLTAIILILSACGGGGSDKDNFANSISGRWTGQLYQNSGIYCSGGEFLAVGLGVPTSVAFFDVSGGDSLGSEVVLENGACEYIGQRDLENSVSLIPIQSGCGDAVIITDIHQDGFQYITDPSAPSPGPNGEPNCVISEAGQVTREQ